MKTLKIIPAILLGVTIFYGSAKAKPHPHRHVIHKSHYTKVHGVNKHHAPNAQNEWGYRAI